MHESFNACNVVDIVVLVNRRLQHDGFFELGGPAFFALFHEIGDQLLSFFFFFFFQAVFFVHYLHLADVSLAYVHSGGVGV